MLNGEASKVMEYKNAEGYDWTEFPDAYL